MRSRPALFVSLLLLLSACAQPPVGPTLEPLSTLTFEVRQEESTYYAESQTPPIVYSGTLKFVVENAAKYAHSAGGGTIVFQAGDFDLGTDKLILRKSSDLTFAGQGMGVTIVRNATDAAIDSEPLSFSYSKNITVRDMTVSAGGSARSTSDALDFDGAVVGLVERVEVIASRGRGIVFDGKDAGRSAEQVTIRDCVVTGGVRSDGIVLLAANNNRIENCRITDVGGHGIYLLKASPTAGQPHKPSNDNVITGNRIENVGRNGIAVNSSNRNLITNNTILNSSDDVSGSNGIYLSSSDGIVCDDNRVEANTATDTQTPKTQRYGLNIASANCNRTVVGGNDFAGNLTGEIRDAGTGTIHPDSTPPTTPTSLQATAVSPQQVNLSWSASTDNIGVTGYEIVRDGNPLATVGNVTTYTDASVQPGTTYSYQVQAVDAVGNRSALSAAASATTPTSGPTTLTFTPVADTYVESDAPSTNYGTSSSLHTDGSPAEHILLKFNVSGLGTGRVTRAVVRLYNTNSSGRGGDFYVTSTDWSETGVTWNSAPATSGGQITSLGRVVPGNWYEAGVTAVVTEDGLLSFKVTSPSTDGAWYASKEGAAGLTPQLVVTVSQ